MATALKQAGRCGPAGQTKLHVIRGGNHPREPLPRRMPLSQILREVLPHFKQPRWLFWYKVRNLSNIWRGLRRILLARLTGLQIPEGILWAAVIKPGGQRIEYGLISTRVVTTAGVNKLVSGLNAVDTATFSIFKFHAIGTGALAEAAADTALGTELSTQYTVANTRATGTQTTGATANVYRTVGTNTVNAAVAITEHGILTQAATLGGTLLDRSVFTVINLANGDSLQVTYDLTLPAGG